MIKIDGKEIVFNKFPNKHKKNPFKLQPIPLLGIRMFLTRVMGMNTNAEK